MALEQHSKFQIFGSGADNAININMSGTVPALVIAGAVSGAHLRLTGSPSVSPVDGDFWATNGSLFFRSAGVTKAVQLI